MNFLACVAGVRRGEKGERRAHKAWEVRTREDRVPPPSFPPALNFTSLPFYGLPSRLWILLPYSGVSTIRLKFNTHGHRLPQNKVQYTDICVIKQSEGCVVNTQARITNKLYLEAEFLFWNIQMSAILFHRWRIYLLLRGWNNHVNY